MKLEKISQLAKSTVALRDEYCELATQVRQDPKNESLRKKLAIAKMKLGRAYKTLCDYEAVFTVPTETFGENVANFYKAQYNERATLSVAENESGFSLILNLIDRKEDLYLATTLEQEPKNINLLKQGLVIYAGSLECPSEQIQNDLDVICWNSIIQEVKKQLEINAQRKAQWHAKRASKAEMPAEYNFDSGM